MYCNKCAINCWD